MSFGQKLKLGLTKSAKNLLAGLSLGWVGGKINESTWDSIEESLIAADFGPKLSQKFVANLKSTKIDGDTNDTHIRKILANEICTILSPLARPITLKPDHKPSIILVTGVNGSGKTTSIGKLAHYFRREFSPPLKIMLVAADTFRAAAVSQLQIWAERADVTCLTAQNASDPAALVYQAITQAKAENFDLVLIDTAGRLNNNQALMDELGKIMRVIRKHDATAPHHSLLVLDATIGQNAINQVTQFQAQAHISGLIVTKLDGTAKAGIIVALADQFALPIHAIGVGEGIDDFSSFDAKLFAQNILDIN